MSKFKKWEIWFAYVRFDPPQENVVKKRPCLVLPTKKELMVIPIHSIEPTKKPRHPRFTEYEHEIKHWEESGLLRESELRTKTITKMCQSDMLFKMGDLDERDRAIVNEKVKQCWGGRKIQTDPSRYLVVNEARGPVYIHPQPESAPLIPDLSTNTVEGVPDCTKKSKPAATEPGYDT